MRGFVVRLAGLSAACLISLAVLNYFVDPDAKFSNRGIEREIARTLETGNEVVLSDWAEVDDRLIRFETLRTTVRKFDQVVVGSSRALAIGQGYASGPLLNLSVLGASMEDIVTLSYRSVERLRPRLVVLNLDPWILNVNNRMLHRRSWQHEFALVAPRLGLAPPPELPPDHASIMDGWQRLVSGKHTLASLRALGQRTPMLRSGPAGSFSSNERVFRIDGTFVWEVKPQQTEAELDRRVNATIARPTYGLSYFQYSTEARQQLIKLLNFVQSISKVEFMFAPYHPAAYAAYSRAHPELVEVEREFRELARQRNIPVYGSYDPKIAGCEKSEFLDDGHTNQSCLDKILAGRRRTN